MVFKKYSLLIISMSLLFIFGCSEKEVVEDEILQDNIEDESDYLYIDLDADYSEIDTENASFYTDKQLKDLYGKENYDYSEFEDDEEKIDFYKKNEIYYGEEKNQKEEKYLIYVFSPLCAYSNDFFDTLKTYTEKDNSYPVYNLNVTVYDNEDFFYDYDIKGTPTLLLYNKTTGKIEEELVGVKTLEELPYLKK